MCSQPVNYSVRPIIPEHRRRHKRLDVLDAHSKRSIAKRPIMKRPVTKQPKPRTSHCMKRLMLKTSTLLNVPNFPKIVVYLIFIAFLVVRVSALVRFKWENYMITTLKILHYYLFHSLQLLDYADFMICSSIVTRVYMCEFSHALIFGLESYLNIDTSINALSRHFENLALWDDECCNI